MSKKNVALLTLQSLVYLPLLVFFTKSTVVILAMVTVCGLIYVRSLPRFRPVKNWIFLLLASAISAIWSIAPDQSLERTAKFSLLVITIAGLIHVVSSWSPKDRRFLLELGLKGWWVALVTLALLIPAVIFEQEFKMLIASIFAPKYTTYITYLWKPISNNGAIALVLTAFPLLGHLLTTGRSQIYFVISLLGLLVVVFASGSSSALLGLVAGLLVWFLCHHYLRMVTKILTVALPLCIFAMPALLYPLAKNPEPIAQSVPGLPNSFIHRLLIWDFTLDRIAERPLFGWGLDTSRAIPGGVERRPVYFIVPWSDKPITHSDQNLPLHPHNAALQVWLELGLMGVLVVMFAVWRFLRTQLVLPGSGPMAGYIICAMAIYSVAFGLMQSWWLALLVLTWAATKATVSTETHPMDELTNSNLSKL